MVIQNEIEARFMNFRFAESPQGRVLGSAAMGAGGATSTLQCTGLVGVAPECGDGVNQWPSAPCGGKQF